MRYLLLSLLFALPLTAVATPPAPTPASIISLNPVGPPPTPTPVPTGILKVSPGTVQILKVSGYDGAITWNIILPDDANNVPLKIVDCTEMTKNQPIFGYLFGDTLAKKHQFDSDTLVVLATGLGNGKVRIQALATVDGKIQRIAHTVVEVVDATPQPGPTPIPPNPGPNPPDPPGPITPQKLFVVLIEETADAVANRGVTLSDTTLLSLMKDKGHKFRVVDKDVVDSTGKPPADIKRFLDASKGKAYPQLFLVSEKGIMLIQKDLPNTNSAAFIVDLLKKYGG